MKRLPRLDGQLLGVLLVWSCLLVLPIGRVVEVPVMLMALAGLCLLFRHWRSWLHLPAFRLFGAAFLLAWVPMLLSLPDAIEIGRATRITLGQLRFAFAGLFILHVLSTPSAHRRLLFLCAWVLLLWVVDGYVQMSFGRDLFGFEQAVLMPGVLRINALFGESHLVYATVLTMFCPLLFEHAYRNWVRWQVFVVVLGTVVMSLAVGTRSGWISLIVLLSAYALLLAIRRQRLLPVRVSALEILAMVVAMSALWFGSTQFTGRVSTAVGGVAGTTETFGDAVGHRVWIAHGAKNMILDNLVNGVGAGGFRHAFVDYALPDDPYLKHDPPIVPYHAHNLLLQTLSESGAIGAIGLAVLLLLLAVAGTRAPPQVQRYMLPYGLALLVAYFPVNSHMAIYSSFWSQILWWLIALYCAGYGAGLAAGTPAETADQPSEESPAA